VRSPFSTAPSKDATMPIDRTFGNPGTIWTGVPEEIQVSGQQYEIHYVGGTAVGLHAGASGPSLVAWGPSPQFFYQFTLNRWTRVFLKEFPADGQPREKDMGGHQLLSQSGAQAIPVASCDLPDGSLAVLMEIQGTTSTASRRPILSVSKGSLASFSQMDIPLRGTWLFPALNLPPGGDVSMAAYMTTLGQVALAIVSTRRDRLRVALLLDKRNYLIRRRPTRLTPILVQDFTFSDARDIRLPGLRRLEIASVRFIEPEEPVTSARLSVTFTAYLDLPGRGNATQGAIFRLALDGQPDVSFGLRGLWLTPLTDQFRQFICAGEFDGGIVGTQYTEAIAFGVPRNGTGLNELFGVDGIFQQTLGGGVIGTPVTADDGQMTYLFTQRGTDTATVGCRFNREGVPDKMFGSAGLTVLSSDGIGLSPVAARVWAGRVAIAGTRRVQGLDCDRIPSITMLNANDGKPDPNFGAGGFALQVAIGDPAVICPDGSGYYTERSGRGIGRRSMSLRRVDASGRIERTIPLNAPGVRNAEIYSLYALDDGSVLIGGRGSPGWLSKLTPSGELDVNFGIDGVALPRPQITDQAGIEILGVRPDGRIAILFAQLVSMDWPRIGLLNNDGSVDMTYATAENGFIRAEATSLLNPSGQGNFTSMRPFLEEDGSILGVATQSRAGTGSALIQFGLRRIRPDGTYDPDFGIPIQPNPARPPNNYIIFFERPAGSASSGFSGILPVGCGWIGGKLYVVARGIVGGFWTSAGRLPEYNMLIVTRWNAGGSKDATFGLGGAEEAGFTPHRLGFAPKGALPLSATELIAFGEAGHAESSTVTVGGQTYTSTIIRPPQPAIFRISHPNGLDRTFGQDGALSMQMQEFETQVFAGRLLRPPSGSPRVQFMCADYTLNQIPRLLSSEEFVTNFGGIGRFTV
jgi:hypothetical protein